MKQSTFKIEVSPDLLSALPTSFGIDITQSDQYGQIAITVFDNNDNELFEGHGDTMQEALWMLERNADWWLETSSAESK